MYNQKRLYDYNICSYCKTKKLCIWPSWKIDNMFLYSKIENIELIRQVINTLKRIVILLGYR